MAKPIKLMMRNETKPAAQTKRNKTKPNNTNEQQQKKKRKKEIPLKTIKSMELLRDPITNN